MSARVTMLAWPRSFLLALGALAPAFANPAVAQKPWNTKYYTQPGFSMIWLQFPLGAIGSNGLEWFRR